MERTLMVPAATHTDGLENSARPETALICATIVPFLDDGDLDVPGLSTLFTAFWAAGVRRLFAPGTTGEFTSLTDEERLVVIDTALQVFGPDGVFAHVGAATARQAVGLARAAQAHGARQLAAITPYFVTAGPQSVVRYYRAIAEAAPECDLYVYVFRDRATTDVDPQTLARIAAIPGVRGAKMSGLTNEALVPYIAAAPEGFVFFSGNDRELLELPAIGCSGVVSGVSSVFPELFVDAVAAMNAHDRPERYRDAVLAAVDAVAGGDMGLLKAGVARRGLPAGPLRVSLDEPAAADLARLDRALENDKELSRR